MDKNLFQEFQEKKARLVEIAAQAKKYGWIDEHREKQIVDKINNDTLTIGVIGQMKCGKSTFLNAFVFGDTILPSAATPMTATLSVITYGPTKKIEVEFYTHDEWEEQKIQASRNLDDVHGNEMEEAKVRAAKELISKSSDIPGNIDSYLGTTKEDSFDNLIEYVGAAGKYISITKSVKLYYPHEYLKGVEIVDTPGFNDPIVSREERTKEFLRRADVVLLMLYAGRAFDSTDRTILFKNVRECGIGKILIGVNKYDIPYGNGESEERIISIVKEQIEKACKESGDETMVALVKEKDPILLSAVMSLMSQMPMSRVRNEFETEWNNACRNFEISSQSQMAEKSKISNLISAVKEIILRDKMEVLLRKPYNAIRSAAISNRENIEMELQRNRMLVNNLQQPDDEIEERLVELEKANSRIEKKIQILGGNIDSKFSELIQQGEYEIEDEVNAAFRKLDRDIDNLKRMAGRDAIDCKLRKTMDILVNTTLKRCVDRLAKDVKLQLKDSIREFCGEVEKYLLKHIKDFEARDFIEMISFSIGNDIDNRSVFSPNKGEESTNDESNILEIIAAVLLAPFEAEAYIIEKTGRFIFGNGDIKRDLHNKLEDIRSNFKVGPYLEGLKERKSQVIEMVKQKIINDLLVPMQQQLEDIQNNVNDKENRLSLEIERQKELEVKLREINDSINRLFPSES